MARRHSFFGRALTLGGLAAAGIMIYKNRELIRGFLEELTAPAEDQELCDDAFDGDELPEEIAEDKADDGTEIVIVIDRTDKE